MNKIFLTFVFFATISGYATEAEPHPATVDKSRPVATEKTDKDEPVHEDKKTFSKQTINKFIFNDGHLGIAGYMDAYGVYSFNDLTTNKQRPFNSNPLYMNEFGFSYGFISFEYEHSNVRARIALHGGELVERMYVTERPMYKMFREANAGYIFNKEMSLEMGIFPSFYGSETFINKDNQHATRAIMTDFAPDYMAGIRFNYDLGEHWDFKLEVANGWQTLGNPDHQKNLGALVVYELKDKFMINSATYLGNEAKPEQSAKIRSYHNLFAKIYWWRFIFLPMVDVYIERRNAENHTVTALNTGLSVRYAITDTWGIAARFENLNDPHEINPDLHANNATGVEDPTKPEYSAEGFKARGYTLTLEYVPNKYMTMRLEGRYTEADAPRYVRNNNQPTREDSFVYASMAVGF